MSVFSGNYTKVLNGITSSNKLKSINLPVCSYITDSAFYDCQALSNINLPACSYIGNYAF